ncbi:MAG: carbohydrate-binding domain-containing protein [Planctomycetota bacterium]
MLAADAGAELELQIDLRGETGDELAQIWVGDRILQTQRLSTEWQRFNANLEDASIEAKDVRIQFTNDLYEPDVIDRNVYVGTLFLNGEEIDPNGPNSYSTATWRPEDGIVAGLGRGSVLNANGYLQFDEPQGSTITVFARGEEGGEQFRIWAGSIDFLPTTVSTELEAYEFRINEVVDPGSVQIRFINDFYQPENDIDFNLTVDRIEIDGVAYEAEAPEVFQSGVFRENGFESGFLQTDTLQGNGVFQFNRSEQLAERYEFDTSVSENGLIEFSQGSFIRAGAFSDGTFVGTTQAFGFGGVSNDCRSL